MKHYLINPTWSCHNKCSYCWMQQTVALREPLVNAAERPMEDWASAINRDKPDLVDIAGGEPLRVGWIPELLWACPDTSFGLSTNGLELVEVERLAQRYIPNLVNINVSYHPEATTRWRNYDIMWKRAVVLLKNAGYSVSSNIVDYQDNAKQNEHIIKWLGLTQSVAAVSPYECMDTLGELMDTGLCCQGGINHITVAPDGETWPCLTTLRSPYWETTSIGNWLDDTIDITRKEQPCYLFCIDKYVLEENHASGDMWGTEAKPC